jgi:hypothetical protein
MTGLRPSGLDKADRAQEREAGRGRAPLFVQLQAMGWQPREVRALAARARFRGRFGLAEAGRVALHPRASIQRLSLVASRPGMTRSRSKS